MANSLNSQGKRYKNGNRHSTREEKLALGEVLFLERDAIVDDLECDLKCIKGCKMNRLGMGHPVAVVGLNKPIGRKTQVTIVQVHDPHCPTRLPKPIWKWMSMKWNFTDADSDCWFHIPHTYTVDFDKLVTLSTQTKKRLKPSAKDRMMSEEAFDCLLEVPNRKINATRFRAKVVPYTKKPLPSAGGVSGEDNSNYKKFPKIEPLPRNGDKKKKGSHIRHGNHGVPKHRPGMFTKIKETESSSTVWGSIC
ncbi:hypothetical protein DL98DRAFT_598944 [Cadophora sp. DSE1049]|nr:hypothetical protein DL98DRAFT_598944 [Cadophora sp. DSE1049]